MNNGTVVDVVVVDVEMHAFAGGAIRQVEIPRAQFEAAEDVLDLVFQYGQNDFQPKRMPSVSVGDVVRLMSGARYLVKPMGFERLEQGW